MTLTTKPPPALSSLSDWGGENLRQDVRWKLGMPPVNNANYAWIQHFIHHLAPKDYRCGKRHMVYQVPALPTCTASSLRETASLN